MNNRIEKDWMGDGNCVVDTPEDTSFIREPRDEYEAGEWRWICVRCPVFDQCLEWTEREKPVGVFIAGEWRE